MTSRNSRKQKLWHAYNVNMRLNIRSAAIHTVAALFSLAKFAEGKDKLLSALCNEVKESEKALEAAAKLNKKTKYVKPTSSTIHEKDDDVTKTVDGQVISVVVHYKLNCFDRAWPVGRAVECTFKIGGGSKTMQGSSISMDNRSECVDGQPVSRVCDDFSGAFLIKDKDCVGNAAKSPPNPK